MGEYKPPFTITNEILSYVSSISEKIGRITAISSLETKPHLRKNNRIKSIHSSLKIEANSLSLGQVRDVINGRLVLGEQKEIQEVKNAYVAYESLSEINPYSIKDLKKFHGIMTKYLVEEYGEFRHGEEGVFNGDECIFMAPPAQFVPQLMDELFEWMKKSRNSVHPLIMSSVFHYEFVFIHPFADGNGRMARLWHTAILSKWKPVFEYIPIESRIEKFQDEYYDEAPHLVRGRGHRRLSGRPVPSAPSPDLCGCNGPLRPLRYGPLPRQRRGRPRPPQQPPRRSAQERHLRQECSVQGRGEQPAALRGSGRL